MPKDPSELESLFAQAYQLQHEGQLSQAISLYQTILNKEPHHPHALHCLGLTYAQLDDMDSAILYLLQAQEAQPEDATLANNLGNAYKKKQEYEHAIQYYQRAIELKPDYAQAHNNLATLYVQKNNYQQALAHYIKAVHAAPDFSTAHFNLGLLLLNTHQLAAAKTQFKNVIALNPEHSEAQFYLGVLYLEENVFDEAEACFHNALDYNKVDALTNLGVIALKKEQHQQAVDYFSKALALDNDHIEARNNLAATFMHHDRFENALMHYDVLLNREPENIEYLYNSGVAQMALGHLNEAIILFERLLKLQKNHTASLNNMAAIYIKMEQKETAREYLKQALAINPQDSISQHMLHALTGTESTTTPEYAHNLFNNYAIHYDKHMTEQLHYSIPQHIGRLIHNLKLLQVNRTLDLGCGTGLTGVVLREISAHLTGVDIAEKMLLHAKEKGIYDSLVQAELSEFFKETTERYDLITAADVLPYFGDLDPLFHSVYQHLNDSGYFIMTTELSKKYPWFLEPSARFSHHPDYIIDLAQHHHFHLVEHQKIPGRLQNQLPLDIMVYVFVK